MLRAARQKPPTLIVIETFHWNFETHGDGFECEKRRVQSPGLKILKSAKRNIRTISSLFLESNLSTFVSCRRPPLVGTTPHHDRSPPGHLSSVHRDGRPQDTPRTRPTSSSLRHNQRFAILSTTVLYVFSPIGPSECSTGPYWVLKLPAVLTTAPVDQVGGRKDRR